MRHVTPTTRSTGSEGKATTSGLLLEWFCSHYVCVCVCEETSGPLVLSRPKYDIPPSHVEQSNSDAIYDFGFIFFFDSCRYRGYHSGPSSPIMHRKNKSYQCKSFAHATVPRKTRQKI